MLICLLEDGPRCQRKLIHIYEHDAKGKHCFGYRRRYKNRQLRARGFLSSGDGEQHHSPSVVGGTLSTIMREGTLRSNEKTSNRSIPGQLPCLPESVCEKLSTTKG